MLLKERKIYIISIYRMIKFVNFCKFGNQFFKQQAILKTNLFKIIQRISLMKKNVYLDKLIY